MDSKEIRTVLREINSILIGRTVAETEAPLFGHLMLTADSLEKTGGQEEKTASEDEMAGRHH